MTKTEIEQRAKDILMKHLSLCAEEPEKAFHPYDRQEMVNAMIEFAGYAEGQGGANSTSATGIHDAGSGEEVKPWPLIGYAPGNYNNTCAICKTNMTMVDKLCFMCLECAVKETHRQTALLTRQILRLKQGEKDNEATIKEYDKKLEKP